MNPHVAAVAVGHAVFVGYASCFPVRKESVAILALIPAVVGAVYVFDIVQLQINTQVYM